MVTTGKASKDSGLGAWVFVGVGSNLGDSSHILPQATDALENFSQVPLRRSSWWRSAPVDCPPGSRDFLNAVVGLVPLPEMTPEQMMAGLQEIERVFGRQPRIVMHEPRPLDLDLLVFGGEVRSTEGLTLPHPQAHLRRFVLEPWNELAPTLVLPAVGRSVSELLTELPPGQRVERIAR